MSVSYFGKSPFPYISVLVSKDQFLDRLHQQDAGLVVFHLITWSMSCAFIDDFIVK